MPNATYDLVIDPFEEMMYKIQLCVCVGGGGGGGVQPICGVEILHAIGQVLGFGLIVSHTHILINQLCG